GLAPELGQPVLRTSAPGSGPRRATAADGRRRSVTSPWNGHETAPEELSLDPQLRRPRRARRGSLPGGRGRRGKGLGPRGATLLLANARKRQRSTVKASYSTR